MSNEFSAEFQNLCLPHLNMLKRYLFHKISNHSDAEDVLQDVLLAAYKGFAKLKNKDVFKSWIIVIASRKCVDYYKAKAKKLEIPLDEISEVPVDNTVLKRRYSSTTRLICCAIKTNKCCIYFTSGGTTKKTLP
ncbi:MAG: hypothetical protein FWE21_07810 [Defluviitaleaceae bacterium]|nr:hypothetical protein [Defluviitaleaceae bacterium]